MYFNSKINGKKGLPWFDSRTKWEKENDEYFEKLNELVHQLDDIESGAGFYTTLTTDDFDSGYGYVYGRIKELKQHILEKKTDDEPDSANCDWLMDSLRDVYEDLLDLYDSAILYDDYSDSEPDDDYNFDDDDYDWKDDDDPDSDDDSEPYDEDDDDYLDDDDCDWKDDDDSDSDDDSNW